MSPLDQKIKIAEACGWTKIESVRVTFCRPYYDGPSHTYNGNPPHAKESEKKWLWSLPDYLNDLNAIHEVENVLENQLAHGGYAGKLAEICYREWPKNRDSIRATAAQRAEAILKTLNLWTYAIPEQTT